eukprot:32212_1
MEISCKFYTGPTKAASKFKALLDIIGADNWNKVLESAINSKKMELGGKCQIVVNCFYFFNTPGQNAMNTSFGVMVDVKDYAVSARKVVETLYNKRGDMAWQFGVDDVASISLCFKTPQEGISTDDLTNVDFDDNALIIFPIAAFEKKKRGGWGKRTGVACNEANKHVELSLIIYDKETTENERRTKRQNEERKIEKKQELLAHNDATNDIEILLPEIDRKADPPWMTEYDIHHTYTDFELIDLEKDSKRHGVYVQAIKMQAPLTYDNYVKNVERRVRTYFEEEGGVLVSVNRSGDCGIDAPTVTFGGSSLDGQILCLKRQNLCDMMNENPNRYYQELRFEYDDQTLTPTELIAKWRDPFVYLTLT